MKDELLDQLQKSALVDPQGMTFAGLRKTLTPKWHVVWFHIVMG
jgi:hypothetical protein